MSALGPLWTGCCSVQHIWPGSTSEALGFLMAEPRGLLGPSHKNQASADALADTRAPRRPRQSRPLSASEPVSEPKDEGQEAAPNATWNEHVK